MGKIFSSGNKQLSFILVTMFLNFLGFSIIIPIMPFLIEKYVGASHVALFVGLMLSSYALCQFLAAPGLGALSDVHGRRPILLISLFGSVVGYLLLGLGGSLGILFLGRIIDGLTGGNISTVYAYMADITKPQDRGKFYGMLGAAGGFGFMIGPAIGGMVGAIHLSLPLYLAAGITFLNMIWGYFVLPESLPKEHKVGKLDLRHLNPFGHLTDVFSIQALKQLFIVCFLFYLAFNAMYGNAAVYMKDVFGWNTTQIGMLLFLVGLLDIISQGFLVRKLLPKLGAMQISIIGLLLCIVGFAIAALTAVIPAVILFILAIIAMNIGDGLFEPSSSGLISNTVGPRMQGRVQGASQGMQSIARVVGPLLSALVYQYWRGLPYVTESALVLLSLIVLFSSISIINKHTVQENF